MGGLRDSAASGVRCGRFRLTGSNVSEKLEPVVQEDTRLVKSQTIATKTDFKA